VPNTSHKHICQDSNDDENGLKIGHKLSQLATILMLSGKRITSRSFAFLYRYLSGKKQTRYDQCWHL